MTSMPLFAALFAIPVPVRAGTSFCEQYADLVALNSCPDLPTRDDVVLESYTVRISYAVTAAVMESPNPVPPQ